MIISSSAIVLSKLMYRDNDLIVKLLVRELGVTSFIMIKKKQFIFIKKLKEKDILDENFQMELLSCFISIRPFFDYMSEILTTNLNGESVI